MSTIADVLDRAIAERPGFVADLTTFTAYIERLPVSNLASLHAGDLLLAHGCLLRNAEMLAVFERELMAQVPAFLAPITADAEVVQEVQQLTRYRVLVGDRGAPRLTEYSGRGPLGGWLRVVAVRLALDLLTKRAPALVSEEHALEQAALSSDPELDYIKAQYREDVKRAFSSALAALDGADRRLIRFALLDGLTVNEIAVVCRIHRTTVMRSLARIREFLISSVRRSLVDQLRCDYGEADRIVALTRSRLELSWSRLLAD
jgi:RNA polymerase sigma-70 factor (ECF subfamily)